MNSYEQSFYLFCGTSGVETEQRIRIFENFSSFFTATFILSNARD